MQRISILSFKGGTGKTSLATNLADALRREGKKVLLVDCCLQGDASDLLPEITAPTLTHVLMGKASFNDAIYQAREHLDVVPADIDLKEANNHIQAVGMRGYQTLKLATDPQRLPKAYDFILYDHAPSYSNITEVALLATDSMLIPCKLEPYAVKGMQKMIDTVTSYIEAIGQDIAMLGIVPFELDERYTMTQSYLDGLINHYGAETVLTPIRTDATVKRAQHFKQTVFEYEKTSRAAKDFTKLARSLLPESVSV